MEKTILIPFGRPGSGKGYGCECIKDELTKQGFTDFLHISTGDLLRAEKEAGTPLGQEIKQVLDSGGLVSDQIVSELVMKALQEPQSLKIIDGYPRTEVQLQDIIRAKEELGYRIIAIHRDTDVALIKERVSNRRVCAHCKTTHSVKDGAGPKCGGPSVVRADDAVIDDRLAAFEAHTKPLWNQIARISRAALVVDGSVDAKDLAAEFVEILLQ